MEFAIDLIARFAQFSDALQTISKDVENFKHKFKEGFEFAKRGLEALGVGVSIHEFTESLLKSAEAMDQLGKAAQRTGIAIEDLSKLKFAASLDNIDFDSLVKGIDKFNRAIDTSSGAFKRLGLDPKTFKDTNDGLLQVSKRFSEVVDGERKATVAMDLFGKAGAEFIPLLNKGPEKLKEIFEAAQSLQHVFTTEQAQQADEFLTNLELIKKAMEGIFNILATKLLPVLVRVSDLIKEVAKHPEILEFAAKTLGSVVGGPLAGAFLNMPDVNVLEAQRKHVESLTESLRELEEQGKEVARVLNNPNVPIAQRSVAQIRANQIKQQIADTRKQLIDAQEELQRTAEEMNKRPGKGQLPPGFVPETAEAKAARQSAIALAKQDAQQRQQLDEIAYKRAEISLDEFYDRRLATTRTQLQAELDAVEANLAKEKEALEKGFGGPEAQDAIKGQIKELEGQAKLLGRALAFAPKINAAERAEAVDQLKQSVEEINIAYLKEQGRAEDAAIAENNLTKAFRERQRILDKFGEDSAQFKTFTRAQELNQLRGRLKDVQAEEGAVADDLRTKEEEAEIAFISATRSLEAEYNMLVDVRNAKRAAAQETLRLIDAEEKLVLQTTEAGSEARRKALDDLEQRRRAARRAQAETSPENAALQDFEATSKLVQRTFEELATEEQRIQNQVADDQISAQQAIYATDKLRQQYIETLKQQVHIQKILAEESGNREAIDRARQAEIALERMTKSASLAARQMANIFQDAFVDPFMDLINNVKTADQALKAFFNNVAQSLLRIASQNLAKAIFGGIMGTNSTGFLETLFGFVAGAGGGAGPVSASNRMAMGGIMTSAGPIDLKRYAGGGIATNPQVALFGEGSRPEAFVPLPDGRAIPVQFSGGGTRLQAGPSAVTGKLQPARQELTVQLHPSAMQYSLRDWFESELARITATR